MTPTEPLLIQRLFNRFLGGCNPRVLDILVQGTWPARTVKSWEEGTRTGRFSSNTSNIEEVPRALEDLMAPESSGPGDRAEAVHGA
jgi:hypothetical protein